MGGVVTDHRDNAQDATRVVVQAGKVGSDQIGQHGRDRFAGDMRGNELFREERVSLSSGHHLVDQRH